MIQQFINREEELNILEGRFISKKPELIVMYGHTRMGKTGLAVHFIRNKPGIYFLERRGKIKTFMRQKGIMCSILKI